MDMPFLVEVGRRGGKVRPRDRECWDGSRLKGLLNVVRGRSAAAGRWRGHTEVAPFGMKGLMPVIREAHRDPGY